MFQVTEEQALQIRSKYSHLLAKKSEAYQAGAIRAIAAAQSLSNSVNEMGFDYETFAQVLASDHRTLQQNSMRAFIAFCQELAKSYETDFYDGRNEASCKLAAEIVKLPVYLPSV
jgi:hypothetical protein